MIASGVPDLTAKVKALSFFKFCALMFLVTAINCSKVAVSRPEVIIQYDANGKKLEPMEEVMIDVPEEYIGNRSSKNGLMYKSEKQSCNLSHIYEQIKDFMRVRLGEDSKEQDETHIEDEANKMYIYMKLVGKGFWNLLYKDKRSRILSESYEKY